jgi:photosystem II stability/assembly factor-like uncharacterized protein
MSPPRTTSHTTGRPAEWHGTGGMAPAGLMLRLLGIVVLAMPVACASSSTEPKAGSNLSSSVSTGRAVPEPDPGLERDEWMRRGRVAAGERVPVDAFVRETQAWEAWAVVHRSQGAAPGEGLSDCRNACARPAGALEWQEMGPRNIAGRVISVAFDPQKPETIWAGTAGGGLWWTRDFGATWREAGAGLLPSLWISAVAVDPRDPQVVYMGTGEANANGDGFGGFGGMLKTDDGGQTFTKIEVPAYHFYRTVVSSADSRLVLTATPGGVYRSADGGARFSRVFPRSATDLVQDPKNPSRFVLVQAEPVSGSSTSGLFESLDEGVSWRPLGRGLPPSRRWGRAAVAFSPAPSPVLYLAVGRKPKSPFMPVLLRSTDDGQTWNPWAEDGEHGYAGVSSYGAHLYVAPFDENLIAQANGNSLLLSRDGGRTWEKPRGNAHVDTHAFAFHPLSRYRMVLATDGGVAVSSDGGASFWRVDQGFPTVQFYSCAVGLADRSTLFGGTQDNWLNVYRGHPDRLWDFSFPPGFGDVGSISVNPSAPHEVVAVTATAKDIGLSTDEGRSWTATRKNGIPGDEAAIFAPRLARGRAHPGRVYLGGKWVDASVDGGRHWSPLVVRPDLSHKIADLVLSPAADDEIWTLWEDAKVFVSKDGGAAWEEHSPPPGLSFRAGRRVSAGPTPGTAYVALGGMTGRRLLRTGDGGRSWSDIGVDLPDVAINSVLADPRQPGRLFVATDAGVALSTDDGGTWRDLSGGLPCTVVLDLCLDPRSGRFAAATHGRGLWQLRPQAGIQ